MNFSSLPLIPLVLSTYLSLSGLRKRSLSPSGALAAFLTGLSTLSLPLRTPGVLLIAFYLTGSRATKFGKARKLKLEEGHDDGGAGYRNAMQVWCNSASAVGACWVWGAMFVQGFPARERVLGILRVLGKMLGGSGVGIGDIYSSDAWCPLDGTIHSGWSRSLLNIILGHFACCLGDTLASELGILSSSPPILITTLRPVPPGTNGALSLFGTFASVGGGALMGAVMWASLLVENRVCREGSLVGMAVEVVGWGAAAGLFGSLLDSLLGATIQQTRYSTSSNRILTDEAQPHTGGKEEKEAELKTISGLNLLNNNQVNLVSSIVTALFLGYLA